MKNEMKGAIAMENKCPKCGRNMTSTTPEKSYCMKCDILIHVPSGIAYTGHPEEDKFIGSPAVWMDQKAANLEMTAALDSLVFTWREENAFRQRKIPYTAITGVDFGKRKESEIISNEAAFIGGGLAGIAMSALTHVQTLIVKTKDGNYELYISQASDWAERIRKQRP